MQRPLCPYPEVASYTGNGDTTDAANFACVEDEPDQHGRSRHGDR
jgi:feruloyl esterase